MLFFLFCIESWFFSISWAQEVPTRYLFIAWIIVQAFQVLFTLNHYSNPIRYMMHRYLLLSTLELRFVSIILDSFVTIILCFVYLWDYEWVCLGCPLLLYSLSSLTLQILRLNVPTVLQTFVILSLSSWPLVLYQDCRLLAFRLRQP